MQFGQKWRRWSLGFFSSMHALVLVNGAPSVEFPISSGVRQGDPLFPFIFIFAMEGLYVALTGATNKLLLCGINLPHSRPMILHLLYVDDAIFFGN